MAKIDKRQYSKEEWHLIRAQRRLEKQQSATETSVKETVQDNLSNNLNRNKNEKLSFVLGNGTSRQDINLQTLKQYGMIYGCNAIYREFDPDVLIAVDTKMILEINSVKYQQKVPVWTNPNKAYSNMTGFNYFNPTKGWSSGPTALWKASEDGAEEIYILGFDYKGLGKEHDKVNNVYAGTKNYKKEHERATYFGNWLKQTVTTVQKNSKTRYIRVIAENGYVPKELSKLENLKHITVEDFQNFFK